MAYSHMHSIKFGDGTLQNGKFVGYDTYEDWHLIPTSRPTIAAPGVETKFVTIPGMDGAVDLSTYLRKDRPAYGNRGGTFEFNVENDHEFWMTIYPKIINTLHGKKFKMVLDEDDPDYYWEGRFTVDKYEPGDGNWSTVSISYQVGPYKKKIRKMSEHMLWDNFNFEKEYDYDPLGLDNIVVTSGRVINIWTDGCDFPFEVTCHSGAITVRVGEDSNTISAGQTVNIGHAQYGMNAIQMSSDNAVISIDWRGRSL